MYVMYVYILVLVLCNSSLVHGCPLFSMSMFTMHLVTNVHQTNQGLYLALPHVIPYINMIYLCYSRSLFKSLPGYNKGGRCVYKSFVFICYTSTLNNNNSSLFFDYIRKPVCEQWLLYVIIYRIQRIPVNLKVSGLD